MAGGRDQQELLLRLSMVPQGKKVLLVAVEGGGRLRKRLADMGLNIGTTVRVVQGQAAGPLILAVREDTRLAVGRGLAHKIIVTPCDREENL